MLDPREEDIYGAVRRGHTMSSDLAFMHFFTALTGTMDENLMNIRRTWVVVTTNVHQRRFASRKSHRRC